MPLHSWLKKVVVLSLGLGLVNLGLDVSVSAQSQTDQVAESMLVSGTDEPLTLSQAVEIALAKNPLIRATAARRELADAQLAVALATRMPFLQASESVTTSNNPVFVFGSLLEQGRFGANNLVSSLSSF